MNNNYTTAEYLALKSYKPPTESAITRLASEKVELEIKISEIRNIIGLYEFDDVFKIALIKKVLK